MGLRVGDLEGRGRGEGGGDDELDERDERGEREEREERDNDDGAGESLKFLGGGNGSSSSDEESRTLSAESHDPCPKEAIICYVD